MIADSFYFPFYLICTILLVLWKCAQPAGLLIEQDRNKDFQLTLLLSFGFILFFGLRPTDGIYMADTGGYTSHFMNMQLGIDPPTKGLVNDNGSFAWNNEFLFSVFLNGMALAGFSPSAWYVVIASIYMLCVAFALRRMVPGYTYLGMLFFITSFGFYGGGINGIRNADACSIFFLGFSILAAKENRRFITALLLFFAAYAFHHSIAISIVAFFLSYYLVKNTKSAIIIWLVTIALSLAFGHTLSTFAEFISPDDRLTKYNTRYAEDSDVMSGFSKTGFRWDFLLFSAMPILLGWYVTVKLKIKDFTYQLLLNTYILANSIWVIFIYAAFSNRFAALSWALYPFVLWYPLAKYDIWGNNTGKYAALMLLGQWIFVAIFT